MREISVAEQRYKAVLAVIAEGKTVTEVAAEWRVSRQTLHTWLTRYEAGGLEQLGDGSHRPAHCPHQLSPELEAMVLELRRWKPYWGPRNLVLELARRNVSPLPSRSAVYRCLLRAGLIAPARSRRRIENWKRWERGAAMELWQMDVVGGFLLADGTAAKALTGLDDHSRFCISARLMPRERTQLVCDGFSSSLRHFGVPEQVLTDNGKVFTGKYAQPPVEVLFDRICRENGIEHPAHSARIADHHRQDRTIPPHPAPGVRHPAGVPQSHGGAAGAGRVGGPLQHRAAAPIAGGCDAGEPVSDDRRIEPGTATDA